MENKCLFEIRGGSFCSETTFKLKKLSECRSNIDEQLRRWHLSQHVGSVHEHELILNRSGLPHDLDSEQLEELWICERHRRDMGKNWCPRRTCQYPLHSGRKKELKTRNAVNIVMSREINAIYGKHVPMGSRKCGESITQFNKIKRILIYRTVTQSVKTKSFVLFLFFFFNFTAFVFSLSS